MRDTSLRVVAALCGLAVLMALSQVAFADRRVALVIGNSDYQNVARLDTPVNDAAAIAEMLKTAGFDVVEFRNNLGIIEFRRTIEDFIDTARDADIAVVYYAGHGIAVGGINYMVPVDAKLASDLDARNEAVDLERLLELVQPARQLRLVILDACRDNPFSRKMQHGSAQQSIRNGLVGVEPAELDTLVAYAAKDGSIGEDGNTGHSPFATALLKHLAAPGLDVRLAFGRVRDEVVKITGNRQEPWVYGMLGVGAVIPLVPASQADVAPSGTKTTEPADAAMFRCDQHIDSSLGALLCDKSRKAH